MILTCFVIFTLLGVSLLFWNYPAISSRKIENYNNISYTLINSVCFYLLPIFIISLLVGLRYDVGVDYLAYKEIYETRFTGSLEESWENIEVLYAVISFCCYKLGMPYYILFIIMAFIPFVFYYKSFCNFRYLFPFATYCLIALGILFWYFNIQRQATAFFILLYSVKFVTRKQWWRFLLCCFIALGFHTSSIYFLPCFLLYFLPSRQIISPFLLLFIYVLTWMLSDQLKYLLFGIITPFLSGRYATYIEVMNDWNMEGGSGIGLLMLHLVDVILILNSSFLFFKYRKERFDIYFRIYVIGALISNIAGVNMLLSRLPFCFTSMKIIVAAFFLFNVFSTWKYCNVMSKLSFVLFSIITVLLLGANIVNTPYNFVFL